MTATEELRRLLDEHGAEHYDGTEMTLWLKDGVGYRASADEGLNGYIHLHLWCTTPEQAIAATLGQGTCHISVQDNLAETEGMGDVWLECDECCWQMPLEPSTPRFNYCPNCGRKVMTDG